MQRTKWVPYSHRFHIYEEAVDYFQELRSAAVEAQKEDIKRVEAKGLAVIQAKKLGDEAQQELTQIIQSKHINKLERRINSTKEMYTSKAKYNY